MRKITLHDILDIAQYERVRPERLKAVIAHKQARRLQLGPSMWFAFETFETMLHQVQEMMRAERIVDEKRIQREIEVFNELIPDKHQLSATLFIAITDETQRKEFLQQAIDLPEHTFLSLNGTRLTFNFDPRQNLFDRLGTVQFVSLRLTPQQVAAFADPASSILIGFDHPLYTHAASLSPEMKAVLAKDLEREE
ncbi:MAG: DUF3501 family protein [candidate division KSB1 bacterium]|nr:DUF3501 family protein [candidate division KSB1 bacterium]